MNIQMIRHRKELRISQYELAEVSRVPRYKIQLTEQGIACLSFDEAERILTKLGLRFDPDIEWMDAMIERGGSYE